MAFIQALLMVLLVAPVFYSLYRTAMVRKVYPYLAARDILREFPDKLQAYVVTYLEHIKCPTDYKLIFKLNRMRDEIQRDAMRTQPLFKVDRYWVPDHILQDVYHNINISLARGMDMPEIARRMDTTYKWILKNTPHTLRQWRKTMILRSYIPS